MNITSGGSVGNGASFVGGAVVGGGATAAAMWAKKVQSRASIGLGLGVLNTGIAVVGGNSNNTQAIAAANLGNQVNALTVLGANPTAAEFGQMKLALGQAVGILSQGLSNTDPISVVGLRTLPTLPVPTAVTTAGSIPAATVTTSASSLGNIGLLLIIGLGVYLAVRD